MSCDWNASAPVPQALIPGRKITVQTLTNGRYIAENARPERCCTANLTCPREASDVLH